LVLWLF